MKRTYRTKKTPEYEDDILAVIKCIWLQRKKFYKVLTY